MPSRTISLQREVIPSSRPGCEDLDIRTSPAFCGYCLNLSELSAYELLPSFNVSTKRDRVSRGTRASLSQGGEEATVLKTWEFSVGLADVSCQAAEGCSSCLLLKTAVELITLDQPELQICHLGLTVEFCEGDVLLGNLYTLLPEDQRDTEFSFGGGMVSGAISSAFKSLINSFELYTLPDTFCPWTAVGSSMPFSELGEELGTKHDGLARHAVRDSRSEECLQSIKHWIRECEETHQPCQMSRNTSTGALPRRLIAVGGDGNAGIHLVETDKQAVNDPVSYVCLSHCWGKVQPLRTESETLARWKKNIPWTLLPRTFQDAVTMTRYLGFDYLWIDSLAIIQDSLEDWETEAANMGSIYHSASLVIAATGSANGDGGCFFDRPGFSVIHGTDVHGSDFTVYARSTLSHRAFAAGSEEGANHQVSEEAYPLLTRAWVVQEQLLGRFILHFTRDEVVFQCLTGANCECGALKNFNMDPMFPLRLLLARSPTERHTLGFVNDLEDTNLASWRDLILNYSRKSISRDTDRLPALAGMASKWAAFSSGKYLAGLWAKDIVRDIMWMNKENDERSSVPYLAPSWSWVSTARSCAWVPIRGTNRFHVRIDLEKTDCIVKGLNPYGEVQMGWLHITGPVLRSRGRDETRRETRGIETLILRYFTQVTHEKSGFGIDFRLFLERVTDSELVGYPDYVQTHVNVFKRVGCRWGYPDRDSYDEKAFEHIEMYLI